MVVSDISICTSIEYFLYLSISNIANFGWIETVTEINFSNLAKGRGGFSVLKCKVVLLVVYGPVAVPVCEVNVVSRVREVN